MEKKKRILIIDLFLIVIFAFAAISGENLHHTSWAAGGQIWGMGQSEWWHLHLFISLICIAAGAVHIYQHRGWFRQFLRSPANKSRVTAVIAAGFFIVSGTGLIILFFPDSHTPAGHLHGRIAQLFIILCLFHLLRRIRLLKNLFSGGSTAVKQNTSGFPGRFSLALTLLSLRRKRGYL